MTENFVGTVYTATATDPQGQAINWSISSGADAVFFAISSAGVLSFREVPNYDLFADANNDNVYEVEIRATAGDRSASRLLQITVANDFEGIAVTRLATGLSNPVGMASLLAEGQLVVAERGGRVLRFDAATRQFSAYSPPGLLAGDGEILDVFYAFDGEFFESVMLLTHSQTEGVMLKAYNPGNGRSLQRRLAGPTDQPVQASLFASSKPNFGGSVMAAIGDPAGNLAQEPGSGYGKLWEITTGDPYAGASLSMTLLYLDTAIIGDGIRAPGGGGIFFGQTLLADQGGTQKHELSLFPSNARPLDFGWPFYEGSSALSANPPAGTVGPILEYEVGNGPKRGTGIVVGAGYAGDIAGINGQFVFGDKSGKIWSIPSATLNVGSLRTASSIENRTEDFKPDAGTIDSPIAFVLAFQTLFILDADGEIFRVDPR